MIKKLRTIALGTVAIAAVMGLFVTRPVVATHQAQAQVCNPLNYVPGCAEAAAAAQKKAALIVNKAILLFGVKGSEYGTGVTSSQS